MPFFENDPKEQDNQEDSPLIKNKSENNCSDYLKCCFYTLLCCLPGIGPLLVCCCVVREMIDDERVQRDKYQDENKSIMYGESYSDDHPENPKNMM
jgi:hypothetical protein